MKPVRALLASAFLFACGPLLHAAGDEFLFLRVAWNNPFNPSQGQETRFEYLVRGQDSPVRLWVFTLDGHRVLRLADHVAQADVLYTRAWDGRNEEGQLVDSGVYFVVLDTGQGQRKVRRVAVLKE